MQDSSVKLTRCHCHLEANYPSLAIRTEKALGTWIVKNEKTDQREHYRIYSCGHAVHERCAKIIARMNQDFKENLECPMCSLDWTRPAEISAIELTEKNNPNVQYNSCLCNERIRVYKANASGEWKPSIASFKAYPCGHGCHVKCHEIFWQIRQTKSENCPLCLPGIEDRRIAQLNGQVEELLSKIRLQQDTVRKAVIDKRKELEDWRVKRQFIVLGVLLATAVCIRFGHHVTDIKYPIPLTKFTIGDLIVAVIAVALSTLVGKLIERSK